MATSMPENMDMLSEKEGLNVLSKSKEDLFGKTILKLLAKTSKNNKELQDLLVKHSDLSFPVLSRKCLPEKQEGKLLVWLLVTANIGMVLVVVLLSLFVVKKNAGCPADTMGDSFISNIFCVQKKGGGKRPVINLKRLNEFLRYEHFKMEGIHLLNDLLLPKDWMV
jgi:hypothetical protein